MKLINYLNQNKFPIIYIFFIIFYFLIYGPYGYDDVDGGYTLSLSWRIFNGEVPYRDIILVRPPLSPLFHTLTLFIIPDNYQLIFERFFTYFLIAISSLLGTLTLSRVFQFKDFNLNPFFLATLGFVISVRNFPPIPWHTIDGVFFASLGIYTLVSFTSNYSISFGIFFLVLSALCKQSFYLLPFAAVIYIFLIHRDKRKTLISIGTLLFLIGLFFLALYKLNILKDFINLTTGSTKLKDLFDSGFASYTKFYSLYLLAPICFWIIIRNFPSIVSLKGNVNNLVPYFFILLIFTLPVSKFIFTLTHREIVYDTFYVDSVAKLFFIITIFFLLDNLSLNKNITTLWFLVLISWTAGISWGYPTPVLFSIPLVFCFLLISHQYFGVNNVFKLTLFTLSISTIAYFIAYQKPYCSPMRNQLNYKLSELFPKLKYIKVGSDTHDKYTEFASLVNKYGSNFKTLPGMPLANFLTNTNSPIKIDWVFDSETNYENAPIIKTLESKNTIIFNEKKPQLIKVTNIESKLNSFVAYFIKTNWQKIDSTNYFDVYRYK